MALAEVATTAAEAAARLIADSRPHHVEHKPEAMSLASQVVTEVDRQSEAIIVSALQPTLERFGLGLLTEEADDDRSRLTRDAFWCIDPLDGTLPFIEGSPGYAVSIALVARDGSPLIGVVCDPVRSTTWHAIAGLGVACDGEPWVPDAGDPRAESDRGGAVLSVFADRSFEVSDDRDVLVASLGEVAVDLGLEGVRIITGRSAVMNAIGVLSAAPACYLKHPKPAGGGSLWDFAATACLFNEAGAVATDIHGAPLDLNRADSTFMNHRGVLFATDDVLADRLRSLDPRRRGKLDNDGNTPPL